MNENMAASIFVLPFLSFSFITYLNGGAAVLFDSQNPTGAAERTFCFSGGVAALTGSPLPFTTEQGGCLCTSLLHYLLIFSLTLAFLSNMYYYFFGGLLAALVLQALQNKCDASEGGRLQGFMGNMIQYLRKLNTTCVEHLWFSAHCRMFFYSWWNSSENLMLLTW